MGFPQASEFSHWGCISSVWKHLILCPELTAILAFQGLRALVQLEETKEAPERGGGRMCKDKGLGRRDPAWGGTVSPVTQRPVASGDTLKTRAEVKG